MILGVDPGVRKLGYALIQPDLKIIDSGILLLDQKSPSRQDQFERIEKIYEFFKKLLSKYKITTLSMEKLFFTKFNQSNAEFVYGVRGVILLLCIQKKIKIREFTPIELKKFITGNGRAEKILVQKCVMKLFGMKDMPEYNDAADALGLAYIASKIK